MFFWMTALFTLLLFPFTLICGRPVLVTTARHYVTPKIEELHPWSKWTPMVEIRPWGWFLSHMEKSNIGAYAFAGFVAFRVRVRETEIHEAIHVMHQSEITPIFYALVYVMDWLVFLPFRKWFPANSWRRSPVAEVIAYYVADKEDPDKS